LPLRKVSSTSAFWWAVQFTPTATTGRLLNGDKPGDLPIQQATTKVEMYINLKTAKTFDVNIPNTLIGRADEVIE
jgi:ABC-type uncharacterized transport system substrate-binding protein